MSRQKLLYLAFLGALVMPAALAEEDPEQDKTCLRLVSIDSVEAIDNQHIRFEMVNGDTYISELPNKCPGLYRNKAIMYKTSLSQLCDLDIITVLDQSGGGYERGASCGLGKFVLMDTMDDID